MSQLPEAKLIVPRQYDLTIKFLGKIPEEALPELQNRLSVIHFAPFKATITNLGVFSERMIRVVWVGLQPAEAFYNLHDLIDTALLPLFPPDERFVPHITLARVKSVKDRKAFLERLSHISVESLSFPIDRVILIKSELTSAGACHTPIFETQTMLPL
jgi:2'-5' RNA ligase